MKKTHLFTLAITICTLFQSCAITSENTYHEDATSSILLNMDMKEAMNMIKSLGDSSEANPMNDFSKYAKDWESLYDSAKKQAAEKGEKFAPAADTAKVMKKFFTKMNLDENGNMEGVSIKYDRLSNAELNILAAKNSKEAEPLSVTNIGDWNGKTLTLDLSKLNTDNLMKNGTVPGEESNDSMNEIFKMIQMTFSNTIKFEQKIKSIKGKHDWITKKDHHTLLLSFDLMQLTDKDLQLKNKDSKIVITTE